MIFVEINYEIHDAKFLTIVTFFKHWRHYLKKIQHEMLIFIDHWNFSRFMIITSFFSRQIRWAQELSRYNFHINYRFDIKNFANELFKRSNYMFVNKKNVDDARQIFHQLQKKLKCDDDDVLQNHIANEIRIQEVARIKQSQEYVVDFDHISFSYINDVTKSNAMTTKWKILIMKIFVIFDHIIRIDAMKKIFKNEKNYRENTSFELIDVIRSIFQIDVYVVVVKKKLIIFSNDETKWKNKNDILWYENRLYLSKILRIDVIARHHDDSLTSHFDTKKILKLIRRKCYWSN